VLCSEEKGGSKGTGGLLAPRRRRNQAVLEKMDYGTTFQKVDSMGKENLQASADSPEEDDAEEFRRLLQSDDIAPVNAVTYGKRVAEIILRALKHKLPWSQD
jgi:hypothetical protein